MAQIILRSGILLLATLVVIALMWVVASMVSSGLSADMMGFEQEPSQGWNYWRWYYLKQSFWGILGSAGILLLLACLVAWGWVAFVRDIRRKQKR